MAFPETLQTQLDSLDAVITGYTAKLAALAADPKPTYSLDGESYDRNQFREHLLKGIKDASEAREQLIKEYNRRKPFWITTRQVLQ